MKKSLFSLFLLSLILVACATSNIATSTEAAVSTTLIPVLTQPILEMPSIGDGGLFSGQPCRSPCFFGINIGATRFDQVIPTLRTNGIFQCVQVDETNIFCSSSDIANVVISMNESTSLVEGIAYNPSVSILVEDIIEKYGEPNSIYLELDNTTGAPESPELLMSLSWDSINLRANLADIPAGDQSYIVESTTEVQWITLGKGEYSAPSQSWKGYGVYKP